MTTEILWSPALPPAVIAALAGLAAALLLVQVLRAGMKGVLARAALLGALILALLVPSISVEERTAESDIALIVIDESTSQRIGVRRAETEAAVAAVRESFAEMPGLDVRTVTLGDGDGSANKGSSRSRPALPLTSFHRLTTVPWSRSTGCGIVCGCCWCRASRTPVSAPGAIF